MSKPTLLFLFLALFACKNEPAAPVATPQPEAPKVAKVPVGSKVYAHAVNGLVLRQTPSADGAKLGNVPFNGSPLEVLVSPDPANVYVAETIGPYEVKGGWVKVRTSENKEGYLFEGYLSRYAPLVKEPEGTLSSIEAFYQTVSALKGKPEPVPAKNGAMEGSMQRYADGARYELEFYEGGVTHNLVLPPGVFTLPEALVVFRSLWFGKHNTTTTYNEPTKTVMVLDADGYQALELKMEKDSVMLKFQSAD
ncbi:MAG: SH3 domain-containing protein [Saprospiraceae bacterium]|nr:SH3 domain-containing protein [Saprospiraceae bacterium]